MLEVDNVNLECILEEIRDLLKALSKDVSYMLGLILAVAVIHMVHHW